MGAWTSRGRPGLTIRRICTMRSRPHEWPVPVKDGLWAEQRATPRCTRLVPYVYCSIIEINPSAINKFDRSQSSTRLPVGPFYPRRQSQSQSQWWPTYLRKLDAWWTTRRMCLPNKIAKFCCKKYALLKPAWNNQSHATSLWLGEIMKAVYSRTIVKDVVGKEKNDSGRTCCSESIGSVGFEQSSACRNSPNNHPFRASLACKNFLAHET